LAAMFAGNVKLPLRYVSVAVPASIW